MSDDLALVSEGALERGDVLLSKAHGHYAEMICSFDKSIYSHAAIWSGSLVIEAVPHAVVARPLPASVNATERKWVHLFRWREADRSFTTDLITRIERYIGEPYALVDVLLIAHAALTAPQGSDFRANLPALISELREFEQLGERAGFTCSELIARGFYESGHALDLPVTGADPVRATPVRGSLPKSQDPQLQELLELCERIAARERSLRDDPARAALPAFHVVSPGDISRSKSLYCVGQLELSPETLQFKNTHKPKPRPRAKRDEATNAAELARPGRAVRPRAKQAHEPEKLLYIALAAEGRAALDSDGEYSAILDAILRSKHRDRLEVCAPELGSDALRAANALDWKQPTYVHVAGHADPRGLAALGGALDVEHLLATLGTHAENVRVVVLNACHTAALARTLSEHIDVVIGMRGEIRDSAAKAFAEALYSSLGNGRTLADAFRFAREQLRQRQGQDLAQLEAKRVDPGTLRLTPEPRLRMRVGLGLAGLAALVLLSAIPVLLGASTRPQPVAADLSLALVELRISAVTDSGAMPVNAQTQLHKGAKLRLSLRPRHDVFLYVLHVDPQGTAALLYASTQQPLATGTQLVLPEAGTYELDDEVGQETLAVIASERSLDAASPELANIVRTVERERRLPDRARLAATVPDAALNVQDYFSETRGFSNLPAAVALRGPNGVAVASVQLHHVH